MLSSVARSEILHLNCYLFFTLNLYGIAEIRTQNLLYQKRVDKIHKLKNPFGKFLMIV